MQAESGVQIRQATEMMVGSEDEAQADMTAPGEATYILISIKMRHLAVFSIDSVLLRVFLPMPN